jgi:hypothetical protein
MYSYVYSKKKLDLIKRSEECATEIRDEIKDKVDDSLGDSYWRVFKTFILMMGTFNHMLPDGCIWSMCNLLNIEKQSSFNDFIVNKLGPGYCYLLAFPPDKRLVTMSEMCVFPSLKNVLDYGELDLHDFYVDNLQKHSDVTYAHLSLGRPDHSINTNVLFKNMCLKCHSYSYTDYYSFYPIINCKTKHEYDQGNVFTRLVQPEHGKILLGGVMDLFRQGSSSSKRQSIPSRKSKSLTNSQDHGESQVLNFKKSVKGDGIEPDMTRDLFSVPKPEETENMSDHIGNHKTGDMFPYLAVVGNEEESKESRLSRLRAFKSPYGKENKPEMRINGVILDEQEGTILVQHLKDYVDQTKLNRVEARQNKKFKTLETASFKKPYLLITRITGEYVPLMSSTSDYTDLHFTLEDGRLLDHQTIVQSGNLPTNQNGVFELSCDYCVNVKDLSQLSLKYFLARPIMKEGFQWGSISLTVRMSESDTPYLIPKVEAMAIVRTPFTTLEEHDKDPDHADVVFTSGQIEKFREMYKQGDIVDVDQAKQERTKLSSYSKSSLRGGIKGEQASSHLGEQNGWEHLKGMRKPLLPEGEASVSNGSDVDNEDDINVSQFTKDQYEAQQEELRKQFANMGKTTPKKVIKNTSAISSDEVDEFTDSDHSTPVKKLRFQSDEGQAPNTRDVYNFD